MGKWYGSIDNRIEEGKNYNKDKLIHEGDDITMYHWSDRTCYYVTKVIDQKHIMVHKYKVCADHSKEGEMGHQDWLYFKTLAEMNKYLNSCHLKGLDGKEYNYDESVKESEDEEWVYRYNHWNRVSRYNKEILEKIKEDTRRDLKDPENVNALMGLVRFYTRLSDEELVEAEKGKEIVKYHKISEGISFGVKEYFYDWSF